MKFVKNVVARAEIRKKGGRSSRHSYKRWSRKEVVVLAEIPKKRWSLGPKLKKVVARAEILKNGGRNGHLFWKPLSKTCFVESGFQKMFFEDFLCFSKVPI